MTQANGRRGEEQPGSRGAGDPRTHGRSHDLSTGIRMKLKIHPRHSLGCRGDIYANEGGVHKTGGSFLLRSY